MEFPNQFDKPTATGAPPPLPAGTPRLTAENIQQIADARGAVAKIRRAVSVAQFDGWSIGVFGGLTLICGFTSFWGVVIGMGMIVMAFVELRAADKLRRLDIQAIPVLMYNQIVLASLLIIYAIWNICTPTSVSSSDLASLGADMPAGVMGLARMITALVYGGLIAVAIFGQGGLALYYHTREKYLRDYLAKTPGWIIDMQQAGVSL